MKVLVIGSGGREHALAWKISQSPQVEKIFCSPGNPGTMAVAENVDISPEDIPALLEFASNDEDLLTAQPVSILRDHKNHGRKRCLGILLGYRGHLVEVQSRLSHFSEEHIEIGIPILIEMENNVIAVWRSSPRAQCSQSCDGSQR